MTPLQVPRVLNQCNKNRLEDLVGNSDKLLEYKVAEIEDILKLFIKLTGVFCDCHYSSWYNRISTTCKGVLPKWYPFCGINPILPVYGLEKERTTRMLEEISKFPNINTVHLIISANIADDKRLNLRKIFSKNVTSIKLISGDNDIGDRLVDTFVSLPHLEELYLEKVNFSKPPTKLKQLKSLKTLVLRTKSNFGSLPRKLVCRKVLPKLTNFHFTFSPSDTIWNDTYSLLDLMKCRNCGCTDSCFLQLKWIHRFVFDVGYHDWSVPINKDVLRALGLDLGQYKNIKAQVARLEKQHPDLKKSRPKTDSYYIEGDLNMISRFRVNKLLYTVLEQYFSDLQKSTLSITTSQDYQGEMFLYSRICKDKSFGETWNPIKYQRP